MLLAHEPEVARRGDSQTGDSPAPVGRAPLPEALAPGAASPAPAVASGAPARPRDHDQRTIAALAGVDVMGHGGRALPHFDQIQRSFGRHDVSQIQAYTGGSAAAGARAIGASAYATGDHVALGGSPELHTVAHEAAHVVQQRSGEKTP